LTYFLLALRKGPEIFSQTTWKKPFVAPFSKTGADRASLHMF
jgi:hypothetical protein